MANKKQAKQNNNQEVPENNVVVDDDQTTRADAQQTPEPETTNQQDAPAAATEVGKINKKEQNEETVSVPKNHLDELLQRMNELENFKRDFEKAAPKDQIKKMDQMRAEGKLVKSVKIRFIDDKAVLGWKTIKDNVWFEGSVLKEQQIVEVYLEGEETREMELRDFSRQSRYFPFEVVGESKDQNGEVYYTVKGEDGKEYTIGSKYVN